MMKHSILDDWIRMSLYTSNRTIIANYISFGTHC